MQSCREERSWRMLVGAKSPNFNFNFRFRFRFRASNNCAIHRFSFFLNLPNFFSLRLHSHSHPPSRLRLIPATLSRFFHTIFHSPHNTPSPSTIRCPCRIQQHSKDLIISGLWMLLPFLVQLPHIWNKYGKGVLFVIMTLTLPSLGLLAVLLMKKGKRTKFKPVRLRGLRNCIPIIAASSLLFMLAAYWDTTGIMYGAKQVWEFIS